LFDDANSDLCLMFNLALQLESNANSNTAGHTHTLGFSRSHTSWLNVQMTKLGNSVVTINACRRALPSPARGPERLPSRTPCTRTHFRPGPKRALLYQSSSASLAWLAVSTLLMHPLDESEHI